ncbi:alpha-2-macroglobulin family protein [Flavobacteriaceae bacterium MHTCC 0001]
MAFEHSFDIKKLEMNVALAKQTIIALMILLFSTLTNAQNNNYENLWEAVEKLEKEGLTASALKEVERIATKAKKGNKHSQFIKSMLYKSKYALVLEEDAQLNIIESFKNAIEETEFPTNHILESILANLYWQYFEQHRWQFYNRTKTSEKVNPEDFRTWDLQTLFNEVHVHFQNSLKSGLLLQQEPLKNYSILLSEQKDSKQFRPTLFDFLAHNALQFYKTNETHITKPAYKFEIDDVNYLADAQRFSVLNIQSKDSTSLQLNALKIYKDLTRFHLKNRSSLALVDVNIERLKFVYEHATFGDKDTTYLTVLKSESEHLKSHKTSGLYDFEIASTYYTQSLKYNPKTDNTYRWKAKEAMEICNNVILKFQKSRAAEKCKILQSQIQEPTLQITTETFLPIQKNARVLVSYKNLDNLNFNAYPLSEKAYEKFEKTYRQDEQWAFIQKLKSVENWHHKLRDEGDFQNHSTEILLPKLNNGRYLIVASDNENPQANFAFADIQVTNLAVLETETPKHKIFQIISRNNGAPIANADITMSYLPPRSRSKKSKTYRSNALGEIQVTKNNEWYRNITLKVTNGDDTAHFGSFYMNQLYENPKIRTNYNAFLFTDRSIYRPGQPLYFKGIAMKTKEGKSGVLPKHNVSVSLYNVNGENLKTLNLTTNDFGSVSGEFILPNNGLNGQYYVQLNSEDKTNNFYTNTYVSVEEYKRPKFETQFTPVTETFKVNDSVTLKGNALAYAGSNITNAKVVYRVHRKVEYPHWYFWYRPYANSEAQEITHGETITDDSGNFKITFKAQPDESIDKTNLPVFNYEITADVTDLNGETRSATTIVKVGYHSLIANLGIAEKLDKTKKGHNITIDTRNLNGEYVPATGTIKIYKLRAPKYTLRRRPWAAPDYQEFTKEAFKNLFPYDAYANEDKVTHWEKGDLVFETAFDTEQSKTIPLKKIKKWASGKYLITLESEDKFGQTVKDEVRTTLYSDNDKTLADQQLFSISTNKSSYNIGDTALITIGSTAENIVVTITIEKSEAVFKKETITLNNNKKVISVPVTATDLGGFAIRYSFAAFNSFKSGTKIIDVPYPKTDLQIETLTFRDKLQPGTDETWQFKIKGPQGDKVSAEILASMYDASLDQFKTHNWNFAPIYHPSYSPYSYIKGNFGFGTKTFRVYQEQFTRYYNNQNYDELNWFGFWFGKFRSRAYDNLNLLSTAPTMMKKEANVQRSLGAISMNEAKETLEDESADYEIEQLNVADDKTFRYGDYKSTIEFDRFEEDKKSNFDNIKIRKNLQETAFFFPQLTTNANGDVSFNFTTPEALTQWKLQLLAHTKTLESATTNLTTVTQKELMVIPNTPRYLREGDKITISTKIANLTEKALSGQAKLILTDAISGKDITANLLNPPLSGDPDSYRKEGASSFTVNGKGNTQVSWQLSIPDDVQAIQYKIIATSERFSDGEQNALPVLSNRMLVTETLPMWIKSNETRTFTLDKLKNVSSTSLKHHKLTLEITSNPAWYAVQALPYLMEYPYDCNEQTFSRYYANALASHIANSNPKIQEVFNQWRNTDALLSNLEKNQELKSILIQETPWLRDAQSETEQKKRIALLFDLNTMSNELQSALNKLKNNQMPSGAWSWFKGGRENRWITQHIIAGFGHLNKLNVISTERSMSDEKSHLQMIKKAIAYLDKQFIKEYKDLKRYNKNVDLNKDHLSYTQLHYLYMRSFYPEVKKSKEVENISTYYQTQIRKYWLSRSLYAKGLMVLISHRHKDSKTADKILKSLKETSITSDELGMYWKANTNSWYWYQAPIETQALMIEAFSEAGHVIQSEAKNLQTIDNLKIWLLKNKQTNKWKTTKSTADAVYALLLQGSNWLSVNDMVDVVLGEQKIDPTTLENVNIEAGTGYYKTSWNSSEIKSEMGDVQLTKKGKGIAWGGLYWQYFEDLDKITSAETPLTLKKKLFLKKNADKGEEITEITKGTDLKVGDLVRVRIELKSDRAMEFVHMKDMRAAGLEPVNVLSQYKWQDGLGYYESTKDASTNFFFDYLPKGVFVFEYDLRINNAGNMSNGITTIQSMYAPEFSSHSEGVRIEISQ